MSDEKIPKVNRSDISAFFGSVAGGIGVGLAAKTSQRDLFTAAALQGLISDVEYSDTADVSQLAAHAVAYADALIIRLAKVPHPLTLPKEEEKP